MYENLEEIYARKMQKQNQEELKKQEFSKSWIGRRKAQIAVAKAKKMFLEHSEML